MNSKKIPGIGLAIMIPAALLIWPDRARESVIHGLSLCVNVLIPSLFPFSAASGVLIRMGAAQWLETPLRPVMRLLFRLPGRCAAPLMMGFLGGYPLGAQSLSSLYQNKQISKRDAVSLSAFCNNAGPAFILGALGSGVFHSVKYGVLLLSIHILSAILTGMIFSSGSAAAEHSRGPGPEPGMSFASALPGAISDASFAMLRITGMVVFFSVVLGQLSILLPVSQLSQSVVCLIYGILELSGGISGLSACDPMTAIPISAALLGWGGLCVHFQAAERLLAVGLPMKKYWAGKTVQAAVSFILGSVYVVLFCGETSFSVSTALEGLGLIILLILLFLFGLRKRRWNSRRNVL